MWQMLVSNRPSCIFSLIQWKCESMCFVCLWNIGFFVIATILVLSCMITIGLFWVNPNSLFKFLSQDASLPASQRAMYSALMEDSAVMLCLLNHQVITPSAAIKTYPVVNLLSFLFLYAVSAYPKNDIGNPAISLYVIPYVFVPDRYCSIHFNATWCCILGFTVYDASLLITYVISGWVEFVISWSLPISCIYTDNPILWCMRNRAAEWSRRARELGRSGYWSGLPGSAHTEHY